MRPILLGYQPAARLATVARTRKHMTKYAREDGGFILITVLGALTLLALITAVLLSTTRTNIKAQANLLRHNEAKELADGLTRFVALHLTKTTLSSDANGKLRFNSSPLACRINRDVVVIAVTDEAGKIDLNAASFVLLRRLLLGMKLDRVDAVRIARAIVYFRSSAAPQSVDKNYQMAGLAHGPKRAPFQTIYELDQVVGIAPALFERLRPLVTVHSGRAGIDPRFAPPALIAALAPDTGPRMTQTATLRHRRQLLPSQFQARSSRQVFEIRVAIKKPEGSYFARRAIWLRALNAPIGFRFLEWSAEPTPSILAESELIRLSKCAELMDLNG